MRGLLRVMLVLCLWLGPGQAAQGTEIDFQAWVDRTQTTLAGPVILTLRIRSSERLLHVPAPEIDFRDFRVEGPAVRAPTSIRAVDPGQALIHVRELVYTLYPRRTGKLVLGPARLILAGRAYETKALVLDVSSRGPKRDMTHRGTVIGEMGARPSDLVFVRAGLSREWAYVGQSVTVDYELGYQVRLDNVGFRDIPSFAGFWAKDLHVAQALQSHREDIEGVAFNVAPLRKTVLFPTRPGIQRIAPLVVSCDVVPRFGRRGGALEGDIEAASFGGSRHALLVHSDSLRIDVRPLPESGRPALFNGAVGDFGMRVSAEPETLHAGDPATLTVVIEGWGNLDAVTPPAVRVPSGVKLYEPETSTEERIEGNLVGGRRTHEYVLMCERSGPLEIGPVRFAYFDPEAGRYRVLESKPLLIFSIGGSTSSAPTDYGLRRRDIEVVGTDIRYIKPDAAELGQTEQLHRSALFWSFLAALPLAFQGIRLHRRHQLRMQGDVAYARRRRARGDAARRLRHAQELLAAGEATGFHTEIQRALLAFLGDGLDLATAGLTRDRCARVLRRQGVADELVLELDLILSRCDLVRFAAARPSAAEMEEMRERAQRLIQQLGKVI